MLYHTSLGVSDFKKSKEFYDAVLGALGYERCFEGVEHGHAFCGYGEDGDAVFFISAEKGVSPSVGQHTAFTAHSREAVQAFHTTALRLGGKDNGKPGIREQYSPTYYAAFVLDPDGHHLEAVYKVQA